MPDRTVTRCTWWFVSKSRDDCRPNRPRSESCQSERLQTRAFPEYPASGDIWGSHGVTRTQQQQHLARSSHSRHQAQSSGSVGGRRLLPLLLTSSSYFLPCQSSCVPVRLAARAAPHTPPARSLFSLVVPKSSWPPQLLPLVHADPRHRLR